MRLCGGLAGVGLRLGRLAELYHGEVIAKGFVD